MQIEERLVLYPGLSDEERAEVDEYVREHPELASRLEEAREWRRLLHDAGVLGSAEMGDDALAWFLANRALGLGAPPPPLASDFQRIEALLRTDDALQERLALLEERLERLHGLADMEAQYRRLTKRSRRLERPPISRPSSRSDGRRRRWTRAVAAAVTVLVVSYGAAFALSEAARSDLNRLAWSDPDDLVLEGYNRVRAGNGPGSADPGTNVAYLVALEHLQQAQQSFLGLFPRFDEGHLQAAVEGLEEVVETEPEDSFLSAEAGFLLGKARLAAGDIEAARSELERIAANGGRRTAEAGAILRELENK